MVVQRPTLIASGLSFSFAVLCIIMLQKPHQKKNNGQAAEQENGTNDMNSDSSASEMDKDSG